MVNSASSTVDLPLLKSMKNSAMQMTEEEHISWEMIRYLDDLTFLLQGQLDRYHLTQMTISPGPYSSARGFHTRTKLGHVTAIFINHTSLHLNHVINICSHCEARSLNVLSTTVKFNSSYVMFHRYIPFKLRLITVSAVNPPQLYFNSAFHVH
jgi:hypothetical protein